jgi:hypothetical protein
MSDFWQVTSPVTVLKKLRKQITLDSFCIRSGENRGSFYLSPRESGGIGTGNYVGAQYGLVAGFTIELWFKTLTDADDAIQPLFANQRNLSGTPNILCGLYQNKLLFRVRQGTVVIDLTSAENFQKNKWTHVAFKYDGSELTIFQDGVKDINTTALAGSLDTDVGANYARLFGAATDGVPLSYNGSIAEIRIWNVALADTQIAENRFFHRGLNAGLQQYAKLNESSGWVSGGLTLHDWIDETHTGLILVTSTTNFIPQPDDYPPLIYGSSFIAAKFEVTLDGKTSLKFPVVKPASVNFMLCVSWIDEDDVFRRYKLWDMDGVRISPTPARYRGEKIDGNFVFEVWNVDGEENCQLEEDLIIYTSNTTIPTSQNDESNTNYISAPPIDSNIFEVFPWVFPLTFNSAQFGTCANPSSQLASAGNYSADLPVDNGAEGVHDDVLLLESGDNVLLETGDKILTE